MKWVDFSKWQGLISLVTFHRMKSQGVEGVCIGSWHGIDANPHVEENLRRGRSLGLTTATYVIINGRPGEWSINRGLEACGAEAAFLSFVAADVEVQGITVPILRAALNQIEREGHRPIIYSARWFLSFWASTLTTPPTEFAKYPYWYALYDGVADFNRRQDTGLWVPFDRAVGHQYTGSTSAFGTTVDFNFFDRSWVNETIPPVVVPPKPTGEEVTMGKILDAFTQAGKEVEVEVDAAKKLPVPIPGPQGEKGDTGTGATDNATMTYKVVPGDNLTKIAAEFGVSVDALYTKNKAIIGPDPNLIQPGQILTIP